MEPANTANPSEIRVISIHLVWDVIVNAQTRFIAGHALLEVEQKVPGKTQLRLNASNNLTITAVTHKVHPLPHKRMNGLLSVDLTEPFKNGKKCFVKVVYKMQPIGMRMMITKDWESIAFYSVPSTSYPKNLFPCHTNDTILNKVGFSASVRIRKDYTVLASGRLVRTQQAEKWTRYFYANPNPICLKDIVFVMGKFEKVSLSQRSDVYIFHSDPQRTDRILHLLRRIPRYISQFEDYVEQVTWREYAIVLVSENEVFVHPYLFICPIKTKRNSVRKVLDSVAYSWFRNVFTVREVDFYWFIESIAVFVTKRLPELSGKNTEDEFIAMMERLRKILPLMRKNKNLELDLIKEGQKPLELGLIKEGQKPLGLDTVKPLELGLIEPLELEKIKPLEFDLIKEHHGFKEEDQDSIKQDHEPIELDWMKNYQDFLKRDLLKEPQRSIKDDQDLIDLCLMEDQGSVEFDLLMKNQSSKEEDPVSKEDQKPIQDIQGSLELNKMKDYEDSLDLEWIEEEQESIEEEEYSESNLVMDIQDPVEFDLIKEFPDFWLMVLEFYGGKYGELDTLLKRYIAEHLFGLIDLDSFASLAQEVLVFNLPRGEKEVSNVQLWMRRGRETPLSFFERLPKYDVSLALKAIDGFGKNHPEPICDNYNTFYYFNEEELTGGARTEGSTAFMMYPESKAVEQNPLLCLTPPCLKQRQRKLFLFRTLTEQATEGKLLGQDVLDEFVRLGFNCDLDRDLKYSFLKLSIAQRWCMQLKQIKDFVLKTHHIDELIILMRDMLGWLKENEANKKLASYRYTPMMQQIIALCDKMLDELMSKELIQLGEHSFMEE